MSLDGEPTNAVTAWLDYPAETLELEAGSTVEHTFTVAVPNDAPPGEYITALVIEGASVAGDTDTGDVRINTVTRQAIAIVIDIPGPRVAALEIGDAAHRMIVDNSAVSMQVSNTGNVRLEPSGEFVLSQADGQEVSRYPIAMGSVYAGQGTFIEVPFAGRLNAGDYVASLTLADAAAGVQVSSGPVGFSVASAESEAAPRAIGSAPQLAAVNQAVAVEPAAVAPWTWSLAAAGAVAVLALLYITLRRMRGRQRGTATGQ